MDTGHSVEHDPLQQDAAEATQLLGQILRSAEQSLRVDENGAISTLFDETGVHARRIAERALALR
jgi:hypothetical protein